LDYADNRYYSNAYGRFMTPDPYQGNSGGPGDPENPQSWNRYAYVVGDPINWFDPQGLDNCSPGDPLPCSITVAGTPPSGGGGGGGGGGSDDGYAGKTQPWFQNGMTKAQYMQDILHGCGYTSQGNTLQSETLFVTSYLGRYHSPLAADASEIVNRSFTAGIDDRFIVALAGVETTYGTNPKWDSSSAGLYNVFDMGNHCATLGTLSMCTKVNPYPSYIAAIDDVIGLFSRGAYKGLNSLADIYNLFETGNVNTTSPKLSLLDTIYSNQLHGDPSDIRKNRCQ
jgi:RHS repeat-associated protein